MRTNKAKYDHYKSVFDEMGIEFLKSVFPDGVPVRIYELGNENIEALITTGVEIYGYFYGSDKPTRKDVKAIKGFVENKKTFSLDVIRIKYMVDRPYGTVRSAYKYTSILEKEYLSFSPWDLRSGLRANRKKHRLKPGDVRCGYCGASIKESEAETFTVISYRNFGRGGKRKGKYCPGHGVLDQMSSEG